jgi:hypothetical protein
LDWSRYVKVTQKRGKSQNLTPAGWAKREASRRDVSGDVLSMFDSRNCKRPLIKRGEQFLDTPFKMIPS